MKTTFPSPQTSPNATSSPVPPHFGLEFLGEAAAVDELPIPWIRAELFFGLPTGESQGAKAIWKRFVSEMITPRFPSGFTVVPAYGQWSGACGKIECQNCRILIIVAPGSASTEQALEELAQIWRRQTGESSVLRVLTSARALF
jgi:hypothetical protein